MEEDIDILKNIKRKIDKQRTIVEKYINACLFERIQGESRFKKLRKILPRLYI